MRSILTPPSSCSSSQKPETNASPSISNSPIISERSSPSTILSGPSSSALPDDKKKRGRSTSIETQDAKRMREDDKFENLLSQITEPRTEEQIFCNFLQSRLQKLEKKYYMRITHIIMQEVMKIELEQSEAQ